MNGGCEQMCTNTIGSFYCNCSEGYLLEGNGLNCSDINECENGDDNCSENANCTNTEGSFTCSCNTGYTGNGVICTSKLHFMGKKLLKVHMNCFNLNLQILTNVNWRYIHATPMLTVLILMAASTAHVWLDLKAMDSTVQTFPSVTEDWMIVT